MLSSLFVTLTPWGLSLLFSQAFTIYIYQKPYKNENGHSNPPHKITLPTFNPNLKQSNPP